VAEKPKGFASADVRRIGDAVRYVESVPRAGAPAGSRAFASAYTSACWVRITGAITARSGANCGSGSAVLCSVSTAGVLSDTGTTITVWNGLDQAIASGSGRYFQATWSNGKWWLAVPGSCTFLP
jgi:hypothetical protein